METARLIGGMISDHHSPVRWQDWSGFRMAETPHGTTGGIVLVLILVLVLVLGAKRYLTAELGITRRSSSIGSFALVP
jgi:hypothetical protein